MSPKPNLAALLLAQLARKASSPAVRRWAEQMLRDGEQAEGKTDVEQRASKHEHPQPAA